MASARYDLHVHTTASDGVLSPREMVALAADRGLAGLAVTDHDTVAGLDEALAVATMLDVQLIPGLELTCATRDGHVLHLLAYFFNRLDADLAALLGHLSRERRDRAAAMVDRIGQLGGKLDFEDVLEQSGGRAPGRQHVARAMVAAGIVRDVEDAFSDAWIGAGGRAWVRSFGVPADQAVRVIHSAGGVAVLAHPGRIPRAAIDQVVSAAVAAGLDGVEVDHPDHGEAAIRVAAGLAREYGLIQTGGSDDHGSGLDGPRLGCRTVSQRVVDALAVQARQYRPA